MATVTATNDEDAVPACTVTRVTSDITGRKRYTAVVDLLEVDPNRSVTAEERTLGISSLNPPTATANTPALVVRLAVEACCNAYEATDGFDFDAEILASISYRVSHTVAQALRKLGEEV